MRRTIEVLAPVAALVAVLDVSRVASAQTPVIDGPGELRSDNGAVQLKWSDGEAPYRVTLRALDDATPAEVVYEGRHTSAFLSGLPDGRYRITLSQGGDQSWADVDSRVLVVQHHDLDIVFPVLVLGGITFVATAGMVIVAARRGATEPAPAEEADA